MTDSRQVQLGRRQLPSLVFPGYEREGSAPVKVLLIAMPMAAISRPSIQLGLLAAIGNSAGHQVDTLHASLDFANLVLELADSDQSAEDRVAAVLRSADSYSAMADLRAMLGDWLFSQQAFGTDAPDPSGLYVADNLDAFDAAPISAELTLQIRNEVVPRFLDQLMAHVDWSDYDVVGFTSTFQQNLASIALARRLKTAHPELITLFGGANYDASMGPEYLRSVPVIDVAIQGEADIAFPRFLDALRDGANVLDVPGVIGHVETRVCVGPNPGPAPEMNDLPTPDYSEFFERAARLGLIPASAAHLVDLPFESARGCWWGAKVHCTFCGLNGDAMAFRSKSPDRVIAEIDELARRHGTFRMSAVDNIVDREYIETVFPRLAELETSFEFFYEVKADLSREDIRVMALGGVTSIQPGIESLNSRVLGLMRKGSRAAWNVNVLRWARYYGIEVSWNMLWGFPGERLEDYTEQTMVLPNLYHLQAPGGMSRIWLERFSPLFNEPDRLGIDGFAPHAGYRYVYPTSVNLNEAAYYFDYRSDQTMSEDKMKPLEDAVTSWHERAQSTPPPTLTRFKSPTFIQIVDHRDPASPAVHRLEGVGAQLHEACMDRSRTVASLANELGAPADPVRRALDAFVDRGLLFRDGASYLSLALPAHADRSWH